MYSLEKNEKNKAERYTKRLTNHNTPIIKNK